MIHAYHILCFFILNFRNAEHVGNIRTYLMGRLGSKGYIGGGGKREDNCLVQAYYSSVGSEREGIEAQKRLTGLFSGM